MRRILLGGQAQSKSPLVQHCADWELALRLAQRDTRPQAVAEMQKLMLQDAREAVRQTPLAFSFKIPFDHAKLQAHLTLQALAGGLSDQELFAQFELLRNGRPAQELVAFV